MPAIPSDAQFITPTGDLVFLGTSFSSAEKGGVGVLVAAASVSFLAIVGLFIILGVSTYKTMRTPSQHRFVRNHVVAYFVSLLLCDFISANGALLNGRWIGLGGIQIGAFCTAQGALKNVGNVGTALWSMILAVHTFCLIVLKWRARDLVLYVTLLVTWAFIALVVIIGPSAVQNITTQGPYFGVAGPWCWITENYAVQRFTLGYFWMFLSALVSFALYSVVFFHLRGNLIINGRQVRLRLRNPTPAWEAQTGKNSVNNPPIGPAKQMLMYPIAYTILVLPIAFCRFLEWAGHDVSFGAIMLGHHIFALRLRKCGPIYHDQNLRLNTPSPRSLFARQISRL
ncbi:hypothetical protein K439DRAFT_858722 [Ramaria rubella]|nr:hypothetical protein K439DRAFT_858722 [Ramaria rubella]